MVNFLPLMPERSCLNKIGPLEKSLTAKAVKNEIGEIVIIPKNDTNLSKTPLLPAKIAAAAWNR
jgi:hypothetical protein